MRSRITSYINNLHPQQYKDLYAIIEQVIGYAIPLWNITLSQLSSIESLPLRINYVEAKYEGDVDMIDDDEHPENIVVLQPEPGTFTAMDDAPDVDLREDFGSTLQVIIKLANIHLTPDKPEYEGGTWHVEGQTVRSPAELDGNKYLIIFFINRTSTFVLLLSIITTARTLRQVASHSDNSQKRKR